MGAMVHGRLDVIGEVGGKEVLNTLWYRLEETHGTTATAAAALAAEWVVTVSPQWVKFFPSQYNLARVEVQAYSSVWAPLMFLPYSATVDTPGTNTGTLAGPAQTVILNFSLDLASLLEPADTNPPRRSYLALGPVPEAAIGDDGLVIFTYWASGDLLNFRGGIVATLEDPGNFTVAIPERVGRPNDVGQRASMLVVDTAFRGRSSFRRSRNN